MAESQPSKLVMRVRFPSPALSHSQTLAISLAKMSRLSQGTQSGTRRVTHDTVDLVVETVALFPTWVVRSSLLPDGAPARARVPDTRPVRATDAAVPHRGRSDCI